MNVSPQVLDRPRTAAPAIAPSVTSEPSGSPFRYVVRCLVEETEDHQWQAFSLELGLAAQADTEAEAKQKLDSMIRSYLEDVICGPDREHAYELLSRKATWSVRLKYHLVEYYELVSIAFRVSDLLANRMGARMRRRATFSESLHLTPQAC